MLHKLLLVTVAIATALTALAQTTAQPAVAKIPDYTLFRFFFLHVIRLQNAGNALLAAGKNDQPTRNLMRTNARLTKQEFAALVNVAASCTSAYAAESVSGVAAVKQLAQQYPNPSALPPGALQQIDALEAQRQQIIMNCIATLQSEMSPGRFQMLYKFVAATESANIRLGTLPPPGATAPKPPSHN